MRREAQTGCRVLLLRMVTSLSTFSVGAAGERLLADSLVGVRVRVYPLASCSR